jgi:putative transposase
VTPHPLFWSLGNTPFSRELAYGELISAGIGRDTQDALAGATHKGWALGDAGYLKELERRTDRRPTPLSAGRPPKRAT